MNMTNFGMLIPGKCESRNLNWISRDPFRGPNLALLVRL